LISGRYQQRFRLEHAIPGRTTPDGETGLPATGYSLPQLLKNNGYATGLIGKWHLGYKSQFSPNAHGLTKTTPRRGRTTSRFSSAPTRGSVRFSRR